MLIITIYGLKGIVKTFIGSRLNDVTVPARLIPTANLDNDWIFLMRWY